MLSSFSRVQLFATPWTVARQAPLSMGFSRQEYRNGLPCPPPGDLPNAEIKPLSLMSPAVAGRFFTTSATWEAPSQWDVTLKEQGWICSFRGFHSILRKNLNELCCQLNTNTSQELPFFLKSLGGPLRILPIFPFRCWQDVSVPTLVTTPGLRSCSVSACRVLAAAASSPR